MCVGFSVGCAIWYWMLNVCKIDKEIQIVASITSTMRDHMIYSCQLKFTLNCCLHKMPRIWVSSIKIQHIYDFDTYFYGVYQIKFHIPYQYNWFHGHPLTNHANSYVHIQCRIVCDVIRWQDVLRSSLIIMHFFILNCFIIHKYLSYF